MLGIPFIQLICNSWHDASCNILLRPPLHFIIFKVLSHISSCLIEAEREFLIDKGRLLYFLFIFSGSASVVPGKQGLRLKEGVSC